MKHEDEHKSDRMKVITGFFWKFGERIIVLGVSFLIMVILSRLLSPSEYGMVAMALVVINIADVFVTAGLGNSLIQKKDADSKDFSTAFYLNVIISVIIYICVFFIAPLIEKFFHYRDLSAVIRVLCLRIPIAAVNSVQCAYISRNMQFKLFFGATLWGTLISGGAGVALALSGFGVWALVVQYLLNAVIDTCILWVRAGWRPTKEFDIATGKGLFRYGWKLMVSGLLDMTYSQIRNLIIGKKYSAADLAYYTNGSQYPQAATSAISTSISSVLFPVLSKKQETVDSVKQITRRAVSISSYLLWPVMLGIIVVAPSFITVFLTDKWLPCIPFIRIACIAYGFWPVHTANLEALKATGHSDIFLKLEIIKCSIAIAILCLAMRYGIIAIAFSAVVTSIVSCFINAYPNVKILKYTYLEQISDIMPSMIKSAAMAVIIWGIGTQLENNLVRLCVQIVTGIVVYFAISLMTKDANFNYLKKLVR